MWTETILVSIIGGLIALDRTAAFQVMVSRPLATAPLIGLVLGQPMVGLIVGSLLELIWISRLPLGGFIPPHECLGAVLTTAAPILALHASEEPGPALITLALLLVLPLARAAAHLEKQIRRLNALLAQQARKALISGNSRRLSTLNLLGLAFSFAWTAGFILVCLPLLTFILIRLNPLLTPPTVRALELLYFCLPLIGVSVALSAISVEKSALIFGAFFILTLSVFVL